MKYSTPLLVLVYYLNNNSSQKFNLLYIVLKNGCFTYLSIEASEILNNKSSLVPFFSFTELLCTTMNKIEFNFSSL